MAWQPDYITVEELTDYMKVKHLNDETEIALAATGASRAVDNRCNRQFGILDEPAERTYEAWYDSERGLWTFEVDDFFNDLVSFTINGVAVTDYGREPLNAESEGRPYERLTVDRLSSVLPTAPLYRGVAATTWGWLEVPPTIWLATRLQGSRFHSRRDSPFGVTGSPDQGGELRLLAKVDPDVAVMLTDYVRARLPG